MSNDDGLSEWYRPERAVYYIQCSIVVKVARAYVML